MSLQDVIGGFKYLAACALQLERVGEGAFRSVSLWTPSASKVAYGGQLVAHSAEAAYRTVDDPTMEIISLQLKFLSAGKSDCGSPVVYTVKSLHNSRSFCSRMVLAEQEERNILSALVSFHRRERGCFEHQICQPRRLTKPAPAEGAPYSRLKDGRCLALPKQVREAVCREAEVASVGYANLMNLTTIHGTEPWDWWLRVEPEGWALLQKDTDIPERRLHIIVACWLSDFAVAIASLFPHTFPNSGLRQFVSLDHTIYFHHPDRIRVEEWFLYEVFSPWAAQGRGLSEGRIYGPDGTLWMSTVQQTLMRTGNDYKSRL
ncbi:putative acyl-CoA thioesterase [Trypanosoma conorhini]|uniref:Putative acyl-CoA thioesterase n=1 Tax=Trypanosoma conorhini TaxID=83891 RepID=A0A422P8F1_9TRYP|nr:putative acyl-CoA thioesterase [Trypanosoma conorhini]RNF13989.1 putative acyl-CoA thioesterase [Trypanosoma conorhini]